MCVCKCDECSFFNYCINMDFESVNKDLLFIKNFTDFAISLLHDNNNFALEYSVTTLLHVTRK